MDLHEQLDELAATTPVPAGDLHAVIGRGRSRQARTRRLTGGIAAVALGATALTFVATADDGGDETNVATEGLGPDGGDLRWEVVEPGTKLALYGRQAVVGGGAVYALSTAPGQRPDETVQPLRMWRSEDGVSWELGGEPGDDLYLSDLDTGTTGGRVYAIGTGVAVAATTEDGREVPELRVGSSDDGDTWTTGALDVDVAAIVEHTMGFTWSQREVATNAAGDVVAVVVPRGELDVPEVVPAGDPAPERWAITADGVDVLGERTDDEVCEDGRNPERSDAGVPGPHRVWPDYCSEGDTGYAVPPQETHVVERSYTWDELGVGGDLLAAVLGRPLVFVARDGSASYERIAVDVPNGETSWVNLEGGERGFDLAVASMGAASQDTTLLHSDDGTTWSRSSLPPDVQWVSAMGHAGGRLVVQGSDASNRPVVVIDDGHVARPADSLDPALVDGREVWWSGGGIGEMGVVVVVALSSPSGSSAEYIVLTSVDGRTWSSHVIEDVAGVDVTSVGNPIVTADRIIVPFVPAGDRDDDGHLPQRALVATAA